MKTNYKIKLISGFDTLIVNLKDGKQAAMLVMPSITEDAHSKTRMRLEQETGLANTSCKANFVLPSTVEEMNSPAFRKAAMHNMKLIQIVSSMNKYNDCIKRWMHKVPQTMLRVYFGGDLSLSQDVQNLKSLIADAKELPEKTIYIRTALSKVVNDLMADTKFELPSNVIIGVEHQLADELPLHNFTVIHYTEEEDAPDDLTSFPEHRCREHKVRITEECKLCASTGKPWWSRLVTTVTKQL